MITHVMVENFKCHEKTELEIGRLTLLVGPNSSGKSSILEAIDTLCSLTARRAEQVFKDESVFRDLVRKGSSELAMVMNVVSSGDSKQEGSFELSAKLGDDSEFSTKKTKWSWDGRSSLDTSDETAPTSLKKAIGNAMLMRLDARKLAAPKYSDTSPSPLAEDGEGLANVVAELSLARDDRLSAVEAALKTLVPTLERVHVQRTKVLHTGLNGDRAHHMGDELRFDFLGAKDIPARLVSEGTLIALGILVATHRETGPCVVLLDDLEHALHFQAQRDLVEILKKLLDVSPGLQIIATSHSPYLVDSVDAREVWVMDVNETGASACSRLWDHPKAERALELLMPGEFYTHVGSRWVTES